MNRLLVCLLMVVSTPLLATNYYLSETGNDGHQGSRSAPWRTLAKLVDATQQLSVGDSIFFERGSTFHGQLTILSSGLYVGAYGKGEKPVFTGAIPIASWTFVGRNIWKAKCPIGTKAPGDVFIDGKVQPLGRYPNQGYLSASHASPQNDALMDDDAQMQFSRGYWDGAELVVRSSRWTIDRLCVASFANKTFHTSDTPTNVLEAGMGYFVQNHVATLDRSGEWFYQPGAEELYIYMDSGTVPGDHNIEISVFDAGIYLQHAHEVKVSDLSFRQYRRAGLIATDSHYITLNGLDISHSGDNGLEILECESPTVENSLITDSHTNGTEWRNNQGGTFSRNTIRRTGLLPGRGRGGNGSHIALNITSDQAPTRVSVFEYNTIDSAGYSGIDFRIGRSHIRYNLIKNFCLIQDDGAGIYTWNNRVGENRIESNTITDGIGSGAGTSQPTQRFVSGIYIDDLSSDCLLKNNSVSRCAMAGILLHNVKHIQVIGNKLVDNGNHVANREKGQLYIKVDTLGTWPAKAELGLSVTGNSLVATNETAYCLLLSADRSKELRKVGSFKKNEFRSVYASQAVGESNQQQALCTAPEAWTLAEWQRTSGYEAESTFKTMKGRANTLLPERNLISNGEMTTNGSGWITWPKQTSLEYVSQSVEETASLKISNDGDTQTLLYHAGFPLIAGKLYRLQFSTKGSQPGKLEFVALMAKTPWSALSDYTCFTIGDTYKTFTYYFIPARSTQDARVNFKSHVTFWLNQVTLHEVMDEVTLTRK